MPGKEMSGKELKRLIEEAGLSRRGLGRELGIADTTVGRWIKGESKIGKLEALGIAYYFQSKHKLWTRTRP